MALFDFNPFDYKKMGAVKQHEFAKQAMQDGRPDPTERKGIFRFLNQMINKKQQRVFTLNAGTIGRLADADPITWAIRRTVKSHVNQAEWDIVADTETIEGELTPQARARSGLVYPEAGVARCGAAHRGGYRAFPGELSGPGILPGRVCARRPGRFPACAEHVLARASARAETCGGQHPCFR